MLKTWTGPWPHRHLVLDPDRAEQRQLYAFTNALDLMPL
jgi:hypothetical protein